MGVLSPVVVAVDLVRSGLDNVRTSVGLSSRIVQTRVLTRHYVRSLRAKFGTRSSLLRRGV